MATEKEQQSPLGERYARREARRRRASSRIRVEHSNAEYKQWRPLMRWTGRREDFADTQAAIAGLVSDRSARRATRRATHRATGAEPALARTAAC
jgi:hypothetical protein